MIGLAPAVLSGDASDVRNAIPSLFAIMFTLLKVSGPLQNTFRSLNRLRGGLPEIKDALELLELQPERMVLLTGSIYRYLSDQELR
jgi:ATP-binding cassette subfamily B protein